MNTDKNAIEFIGVHRVHRWPMLLSFSASLHLAVSAFDIEPRGKARRFTRVTFERQSREINCPTNLIIGQARFPTRAVHRSRQPAAGFTSV
jgi:hypothetical protein